VFTSGSVITSLAMYSSDIGAAGTGGKTGQLFYTVPGMPLSSMALRYSIELHCHERHSPVCSYFM
jgi:hypothetical protein